MRFQDLSLLKKITFSVIPLLVASTIVSIIIYQKATLKDTAVEQAVSMVTQVNEAELEMVKMSEALRGYLLNPNDVSQFEKKKAADEAYAKHSAELEKLVSDDKEITELNRKMADYDAGELDRIENAVAELIQKRSPDANEFYSTKYTPARNVQSENFTKLKQLIYAKAESIRSNVQAKHIADAIQTIVLFLASVLFGLGCVFYLTSSNLKKAQKLFEEVYGVSDQVNGFSAQLTKSSGELSDAVNKQCGAIQESAASLEQITSMVGKNSENATKSNQFTKETKRVAFEGKGSVDEMQSAISEIVQSNDAILKQVDLGNQEIGKIVDLIAEISEKTKIINDIVFQTKLLSFNASVEAARAGEQGKGFAVVAEEVGNLALVSGNAANEISEKLETSSRRVKEIIENTKKSVDVLINQGKEKVQNGVRLSQKCGSSLDQITRDIESVDQMVSEIVLGSNEQSKGVSEINKTVGELDLVTQQNNRVAQASSEQALLLKKEADSLRELVDNIHQLFNGSSSRDKMAS